MKKHFRIVLLVVLPMALLASSSPARAGGSTATCIGTAEITFSPGLGITPQVVEYQSENGTIDCVGAVRGWTVTGRGTMFETGELTGTAAAGTGAGTAKIKVPTVAGSKTVAFDYTFIYEPGIGFKESDHLAGPWTFVFRPVSGDGITTPVTRIAAVFELTLKS
jgi:hypothetical protein